MKTALVTGASSGIGAACAAALAAEGLHVALMARREERLRALAESIERERGSGTALVCPGDVTVPEDRQRTLHALLEAWGRIDVLVNNAGVVAPGVAEDVDLDAFRHELEVNVLACLAWMQLVGPRMRAQGAGRIINMSSVSGRVAVPCVGAYAASKFALEALSDAARVEYAPLGVNVVLIEPGSFTTEIWEKAGNVAESTLPPPEKSPFRAFYEAQHRHAREVAGGGGAPIELVARAVCRAATDRRPRARYLTPWRVRAFTALAHVPTRLRDWILRKAMGG